MRPTQIETLRLIQAGGVTVTELARQAKSPYSSTATRVRVLRLAGMLEDDDTQLILTQKAKDLLPIPELRVTRGDLWDCYRAGWKVVITTNLGWDERGLNNMGAGMALQALTRFSSRIDLARWYGKQCEEWAGVARVVEHPDFRLVFFPVKPLKVGDPAYSWDQKASTELIRAMLQELACVKGRVALALPGCGNGQADRDEVLPLVKRSLCPWRFVVVDRALGR